MGFTDSFKAWIKDAGKRNDNWTVWSIGVTRLDAHSRNHQEDLSINLYDNDDIVISYIRYEINAGTINPPITSYGEVIKAGELTEPRLMDLPCWRWLFETYYEYQRSIEHE